MSEQFPSRRALLAATGSAGAALLAGCLGGATPGSPGSTTESTTTTHKNTTTPENTATTPEYIDYDFFLTDAVGWDGPGSTVDRRGEAEVRIAVGGEDRFGFSPVAVHVDPGTTIVWEWKSPGHNVHATNGEFKSQIKDSGTFEDTVTEQGVIPYFCQPHKSLGMKGALAVGNVPTTTTPARDGGDFGGWLANTKNYDGTVVDETDATSITITIGEGAGFDGNIGFSPPVVRVSPGTTITWEWTGGGVRHDVDAVFGGASFASPVKCEGSFTWTASESSSIVKYCCNLHSSHGERGVIVVE